MGSPRRAIHVFLFAALAVAALPAYAFAQTSGDWSAPPPNAVLPQGTLPGIPNDAQVEIDPAGNTIAVWKQTDQAPFLDRIYASVNPAGFSSAWTEPQLIFDQSVRLDPGIDMAVAPNGTVTAVWTSVPGPALWQATKPKGSNAFGPATQVSASGIAGNSPRITFGPKNEALVAWERVDPVSSTSSIEVYMRQPGKSFSRIKGFAGSDRDLRQPESAIGPKGEVLIVWSRSDPVGGEVIQQASRAAGKKAWEGPTDLFGPSAGSSSPSIAIEPSGRATLTYTLNTEPGGFFQRTRPAGSSSFGAGRIISAPGVEITDSDTAIGPDGTVAVAWLQGFPGSTLHASFRYPGKQDFAPPQAIPVTNPGFPLVAVGGARQIFLATESVPGAFAVPQVTMKPWDSNSFQPPIAVADPPATDRFLEDIAAGQDGWATTLFSQPADPSGQLEEGVFKTERLGKPGLKLKLNRRKGRLVATVNRIALRNLRYSISATKGGLEAKGRCGTNYTPQRSKATCKLRLPRKGTWKITIAESQYGANFPPLNRTVRR